MIELSSFVLYVKDIKETKAFYEKHIEKEVSVITDTFSVLSFENCSISFKQSDSLTVINCPSEVTGGGTEISLFIYNKEEYENKLREFVESSVTVLTSSVEVWGKTFVVLDPDGHRVRFNLSEK